MNATHMRVIHPGAGGGPEALRMETRPVPQPGPGEILIKVAAAGVNRHDCGQRQRGVPPKGATDVLGLEVAGEVAAAGPGVSSPVPGERVCALVNGGGYADYCLAKAELALPLPEGFSMEQGAAVPEAMFTFWLAVVRVGALASGEWLLVHGGASGVGTMAIQLARHLGARVAVTARDERKLEVCRRLGADVLVNYRTQDFVAEVQRATSGRGVDVILDMVGGAYAARNVEALAPDGRLVHIASQQSPDLTVSLRSVMAKRARITGTLLRPYERKEELARDIRARAWARLGRGIAPVIDRVVPLPEARAAHERIESGEHVGKIVLVT